MFNSIRSLTAVAGWFRAAFFISAFAVSGAALSAQEAGTLAGRVTDQGTRLALSGARVAVKGTGYETYTDHAGDYVLAGVPAGAQVVEFGYVGYGEQTLPVEIAARATTRLNATFGSETVQLDKFVIEGSLVGTARAINQQRAAATLKNIVASDEIGRFPDQNAAESLQRIPGVSLYRDQGEGRFIDLRGLNYIYTSVTFNGSKVASPEVGNRAIALDVVPTDSLAALEVTKVPTPDMDGEGLGGVVNIRTKSPFDSDGLSVQATAQGIYTDQTGDLGSKFNFTASNLFSDGKAGLLIGGTWQQRKFGSRNYEIDDGWTEETAPTGGDFYFLNDIAFRDYEIERERYGANAALEFKPDDASHFYVHGSFNRFTDTESRHVSFIPFGETNNRTALTENSATVAGVRRFDRRLRMRSKDQDLFALLAGGERRIGQWTLDAQAAYSKGEETKPQETEVVFRRSTRDQTFRYTFTDTYDLAVEQLAGASITAPASYNELDELTVASEVGSEDELGLKVNARYDFAGAAQPTYVKFGVSHRQKEKQSEADLVEYEAPTSFTFSSLAGRIGDYPYGFKIPQISPEAVRSAFLNNLGAFDSEVNQEDSNFDDWTTNEDVTAFYVMGGKTFGRASVIAGTRYERTEFDTQGKEIEFDAGGDFAGTRAVTASRSYDNWLPGVSLRFDATKQLVFRASWSNSLMRPAFGESAMRRNINREDEEVTVGNPAIETLESRNFDASVEYYLPSLGVISAAVFHKQIDNFSYETEIAADPAFPGYEITSFRNGSDGDIKGLELAFQQQLRFLPAPFDGFGFLANATLVDSSAKYPTRAGEELPFIGQSDLTGNVALTYEKGPFFARLALNWRSQHLREDESLGGDETEDFWIDDYQQLDLSLAYRLGKNWELFAEATNLTNEPFRVYQRGGSVPAAKRFVQFEEYGWTGHFGVRWKL